MPTSHPLKISRKAVRIHSGEYLMRTIKEEDASDRWASWMSDPDAMYLLNSPAKPWSKADVVDYIRQFDQRLELLIGIFDKQSRTHIGVYTIKANYAESCGLINLLIGEPAYRNHGVLSAVRKGLAEYFFETLGLQTMMATALARNKVIVDTLLKAGWRLDQTLKQHVKSQADGAMLDLCLLSLSRETWRARNKLSIRT
jgi:RimJ/RimL family protein N-acetyltransferase